MDTDSLSVGSMLLRMLLLAIIDGFVVWFILALIPRGNLVLAIAVAVITVIVNVVVLHPKAGPLRWMIIGLVLMAMFAVYPILYTVYVSTTNYGFGHLLTKEQAVQQFEGTMYLPEGRGQYTWTAYISPDGEFALWLRDAEGQGYLAFPDQPITSPALGEQG
ncbi:MAG: DUF4896 domain-containing protein, partial [Anaerolineales bacterium]